MPPRSPRPRGAPRGNLNAFKHGAHSPRYVTLMRVLLRIPFIRDIVILEAARHSRLPPAVKRRIRQIQRAYIKKFIGPGGDITGTNTRNAPRQIRKAPRKKENNSNPPPPPSPSLHSGEGDREGEVRAEGVR